MIERLHYFDRIIPFVDTELIKVITGVRRSGKSMMLKQLQNHLIVKGVQKEQIININFEEMRNESLLEYRALNNYLEERKENIASKAYIFLDEIQEVASFERVINSLRASYGNMVDIYITGSNAKLLSGELATFLSGRYDIQGKKLLQSQEKYYVVDHGLRQAIIGRNEEEIELVLENIVLLVLMARGYDVHVGKSKDYEVDFVAEKKEKDGLTRKYIQVSYLIATPETREREFKSLKVIEDNFEKLVLSLDSITLSSEGISHYNLIHWLLDTK